MKVSDYIDEETRGIQQLSDKRNAVEKEADDVSSLILSMREKLAGIDKIVEDEGNKITNFKESREKTSSF